MSKIAQLEKRLNGWVPRPPSTRIERCLFGKANTESEPDGLAVWLNWLVPATALLMIYMLVNQQHAPTASQTAASGDSATMIASNRTAPHLITGSFIAASNLAGESFEWTNGSGSTSSISSLSVSRGTN